MTCLLLGFATAFAVAYLLLPPVIAIARDKQLCDKPNARSSHFVPTPSLGGIGIFISMLITLLFWLPASNDPQSRYLLGSLLLIFLIGLRDDLTPLNVWTKLLGQIGVATIIAIGTDIRINSLHGFFLFESIMPYWLSIIVTVFTIVVIMNAFNLIDGINGLSAGIGTLAGFTLGFWFFLTSQPTFVLIATALSGAYLAFLRYNLIPPTQIFMGDSGSLVLGTLVAILSIQFIESNDALPPSHPYRLHGIAVVAMAVVTVPLFDTLRVFATRMYRGHSPFSPDRRHLHHLLIDYGYSHFRATATLLSFNAATIFFAIVGQQYIEQHSLLVIILLAAVVITLNYHRGVNQRNKPYHPPQLYASDSQRHAHQTPTQSR